MKIVIAIVSIIGFAAVAGAIYVGIQSFDGVVVEHPYERGLDWDRDRRLKAELGWSLELKDRKWSPGANPLTFRVLGSAGEPLHDISVTLRVGRPATARYDKVYKDIPVFDGWFTTNVEIPLPGMWDLAFWVGKGDRSIEFEERVFAEDK